MHQPAAAAIATFHTDFGAAAGMAHNVLILFSREKQERTAKEAANLRPFLVDKAPPAAGGLATDSANAGQKGMGGERN